jgi:hypothetical protein
MHTLCPSDHDTLWSCYPELHVSQQDDHIQQRGVSRSASTRFGSCPLLATIKYSDSSRILSNGMPSLLWCSGSGPPGTAFRGGTANMRQGTAASPDGMVSRQLHLQNGSTWHVPAGRAHGTVLHVPSCPTGRQYQKPSIEENDTADWHSRSELHASRYG